MDFTRRNALVSAQNTLTVPERLRRFMKEHGLSAGDFASIMRIAPRTLSHWLDGAADPPSVMSAVLDLLEECSCARRVLGVNPRHTGAPGGRPFAPITSQQRTNLRREDMLKQIRAI